MEVSSQKVAAII